MMSLSIDPRYPDEKWRISFDWAPAIGTATIEGASVTCISGRITISDVTTDGTTTIFYATGGEPSTTARVSMKAELSSGEILGFNIVTPIRAR